MLVKNSSRYDDRDVRPLLELAGDGRELARVAVQVAARALAAYRALAD